MPVMHKLDCRISDPSSYWGELGPREYVRRYYGGTGEWKLKWLYYNTNSRNWKDSFC